MKKYTKTHEWVEVLGENARIGITEYAQHELGDIVYVELPEIGSTVERGAEIGVLESTKAAESLYAPLSGVVLALNKAVRDDPSLIDASSGGWLFELKITAPIELETLLDDLSYKQLLEE